jgi:hypothetical protein
MWFLIFLLLVSAGGENRCYPGAFVPLNFIVTTVDGDIVQGVEVIVEYQANPRKKYEFKQTTDAYGVVNFSLQIVNESINNCDIRVIVKSYNKTMYSNTYSISDYYPWYRINVPKIYKVRMAFHNETDQIMVDRVFVNEYKFENVSSITFYTYGPVEGFVVYKNLGKYFNYSVKSNQDIKITFQKIRYSITVVDSLNKPLKCNLQYENKNLDFEGQIFIEEYSSYIKANLTCLEIKKEIEISESERSVSLVLDVVPPEIGDVDVSSFDQNEAIIRVSAYDPRGSISKIVFTYNNQTIQPYYIDVNYYFKIPNQDGYIVIKAYDNEGNSVTKEFKYTRKIPQESKKQNNQPSEGDMSWFFILVGVIAIGVIGFIAYRTYIAPEE